MRLNVDAAREQYRSAAPFRHIVLDDLFPPEVLYRVLEQFSITIGGRSTVVTSSSGTRR